jgi:hypothetical protein
MCAAALSFVGIKRIVYAALAEDANVEQMIARDLTLPEINPRLNSPYRFIINPIVDYVLDLEEKNHDREVAVLVPELVEERWYYYLLHNQRAAWLKALLLLKGNQRIIVIDVPWYLNS